MSLSQRALTFIVACGISACARSPQTLPSKAAAPTEYTRSASGIDRTGIDARLRPGDDFDAYANGVWRRTTEIPRDLPGTGVFLQLFLQAEQRTAALIRDAAESAPAAGTNARRIADYYAA